MIWVQMGLAIQLLENIFIPEQSSLEYAHDLKAKIYHKI